MAPTLRSLPCNSIACKSRMRGKAALAKTQFFCNTCGMKESVDTKCIDCGSLMEGWTFKRIRPSCDKCTEKGKAVTQRDPVSNSESSQAVTTPSDWTYGDDQAQESNDTIEFPKMGVSEVDTEQHVQASHSQYGYADHDREATHNYAEAFSADQGYDYQHQFPVKDEEDTEEDPIRAFTTIMDSPGP